jgi:hypothetical protein
MHQLQGAQYARFTTNFKKIILNKQRWLTTSNVPSSNYFKPMQWFVSICSSMVNGFKPGILCSLQMVHFHQNMSELCLWYSYIFNTVHLVHTINWIHWWKKCTEWTTLKQIMLYKQRWLTTSKLPSRNYLTATQWLNSTRLITGKWLKPGILCSLKKVH